MWHVILAEELERPQHYDGLAVVSGGWRSESEAAKVTGAALLYL